MTNERKEDRGRSARLPVPQPVLPILLIVLIVVNVATLVAGLIVIGQMQGNNVAACERVNTLRSEVNERGDKQRTYAEVVADTEGVPPEVRVAANVWAGSINRVPLTDCSNEF